MNLGCAQEIIPSRPSDPSSIKVLVLGLPRTGTQALVAALAILGISPVYHMPEVPRNTHALLWCRALEAKFTPAEAITPPWDRFKFDQLLSGYQAVADYPASIFADELAEAYPAAAIILTNTANEDEWVTSMNQNVVQDQVHPEDRAPMATLTRTYQKACWDDNFEQNGRRLFRDHNDGVRRLGENRKFLEFRSGDGWEPLCEFLGVPVPQDTSFPQTEDWQKS